MSCRRSRKDCGKSCDVVDGLVHIIEGLSLVLVVDGPVGGGPDAHSRPAPAGLRGQSPLSAVLRTGGIETRSGPVPYLTFAELELSKLGIIRTLLNGRRIVQSRFV